MKIDSQFFSKCSLLLLGLIWHHATYCQYDTITYNENNSKAALEIKEYHGENVAFLTNVALPYINTLEDNFLCSFFFCRSLNQFAKNRHDTLSFDKKMGIENCVRYWTGGINNWDYEKFSTGSAFEFIHGLIVTDLEIPEDSRFNFTNAIFKEPLYIERNNFKEIAFSQCSGSTNLEFNSIGSDIRISGGNIDELDISGNKFSADTSRIYITFTNINDLSISLNEFKHQKIKFYNDTISSLIYFQNKEVTKNNALQPAKRNFLEIVFEHCYINAPFPERDNADTVNITFIDCNFGSNASFLSIKADTVRFVNCDKLPSTLNLALLPNLTKCMLEVFNTNFEDISFNYPAQVTLLFTQDSTKDIAYNTYENLLNKFRKEGKSDSYKRLDIEYRNFKASSGTWWDMSVNYLDKIWWNHGYAKGNIVGWTLFFLFLFFLSNSLLWTQIQSVYPFELEATEVNRYVYPKMYYVRKYFYILLYTAYIFFSLKVNFDKLSFKSIRLVAFFFAQYLVGLICLFFIANAILKID